MDSITENVRELYERYPYPPGVPVLRAGGDARLAMSYVGKERPGGRPIQVLDAGCGRGVGLIGGATTQPDVQFTGIDINRVALDEVRGTISARGLTNVRLQEVDLMTLEGLEVPEGGFDVITSSGVLHHLSDPTEGMRRLKNVLAPHGVIVGMVYGCRVKFERVARAIRAAAPEGATMEERIALGRRLVEVMVEESDDPMWKFAHGIPDVEFVDRYLHIQERGYSPDELWSAIEDAGLRFCRWLSPGDWVLPTPLQDLLQTTSPRDIVRLVFELDRPAGLNFVVTHPDNPNREPLRTSELESAHFAVSSSIAVGVEYRSLWGDARTERVTVREGSREPRVLKGPPAQVMKLLQSHSEPFRGVDLVNALAEMGVQREVTLEGLKVLARNGWIYRPHRVEVGLIPQPV